MASSRRTATNENVSTYGSGKDYTSLSTWESATDIDLVTATQSEVLECYAGYYDDIISIQMPDTAYTNSSYFRIIRPADNEGHSGIPKNDGSVVCFYTSGTGHVLFNGEAYCQLQDLCVTRTNTPTTSDRGIYLRLSNTAAVGCLVWGFNGRAFQTFGTGETSYIINCLIHDVHTGISLENGSVCYMYNCTDNTMASRSIDVNSGTTLHSKNCVFDGTLEVDGTHNQTTNTTDTPTYVDSANDNFMLASADTVAKDQGTDLSSDGNYAFDDDILGNTRSGTWDIGFHEYQVSGNAPTGTFYGPLVGPFGGPV